MRKSTRGCECTTGLHTCAEIHRETQPHLSAARLVAVGGLEQELDGCEPSGLLWKFSMSFGGIHGRRDREIGVVW